MKSLVPIHNIERRILFMRGQRVMLDADLAAVYRVSTRRLNEQVRRNHKRFPKEEVVANCDHLQHLRFSPHRPYAFTEHGAVMLASILHSAVAVKASLSVVRAFVRLKTAAAAHHQLAEKLEELERVVGTHDRSIRAVFTALKQLMSPPYRRKRRIGFLARDRSGRRYRARMN